MLHRQLVSLHLCPRKTNVMLVPITVSLWKQVLPPCRFLLLFCPAE
jgi:hypothetical protein